MNRQSDYAYLHAIAYVVFVDSLAARDMYLANHFQIVPVGTIPMLHEVCRCDESQLREKAALLAQALPVDVELVAVDTSPLAGVDYNARIGPLRMVVHYDIQTDTMKSALCLYANKPTNGSGE